MFSKAGLKILVVYRLTHVVKSKWSPQLVLLITISPFNPVKINVENVKVTSWSDCCRGWCGNCCLSTLRWGQSRKDCASWRTRVPFHLAIRSVISIRCVSITRDSAQRHRVIYVAYIHIRTHTSGAWVFVVSWCQHKKGNWENAMESNTPEYWWMSLTHRHSRWCRHVGSWIWRRAAWI